MSKATDFSLIKVLKTPDNSAKAQGNRLKKLREATLLKRDQFAKKYGYKPHVIRAWEEGTYAGLPQEKVPKLIKIFQKEGIHVIDEWILLGTGKLPTFIENSIDIQTNTEPKIPKDEKAKIHAELKLFYKNHQQATHLTIEDDSMAPYYLGGDIVAGVKVSKKKIKKLINKICIVKIVNKEKSLLRRILAGETENHYTLVPANTETKVKHPIHYNVQLSSAAPVIWLRRQ